MPSEIESVSENQVAHWTHLNANSLFLDFLDQVGVVDQVEPVADPLRVQQHRVVQVAVLSRGRLASVKEDLEVRVLNLSVLNHLSECLQGRSRVFFVDEIES